jgi:DNA polymerase-3 subunit epsilon
LIEILATYVDRYDKNDKFWLIGFVSFFDDKFLRAFFERMGDIYYGSWFFYPIIDLCTIAGYKLMHERTKLENFKLGAVAKFLGLEVDEEKQHNALYDAHLARNLYYKLRRY